MKKALVLSGSVALALLTFVLSAYALPASFGIGKGWPLFPGQGVVSSGGSSGGTGTNGTTIDGSTANGTSFFLILK